MKVKFVYCDQPNVPRCAECHARLSVEHESLNLGGVDDYRCDQCGTKLEVAWVPSHRRADVLIEKLSDTMDSDNARALVEEVIREEAEHAHAATVAQLQALVNEWCEDAAKPSAGTDYDTGQYDTLTLCISELRKALIPAPSGATETKP